MHHIQEENVLCNTGRWRDFFKGETRSRILPKWRIATGIDMPYFYPLLTVAREHPHQALIKITAKLRKVHLRSLVNLVMHSKRLNKKVNWYARLIGYNILPLNLAHNQFPPDQFSYRILRQGKHGDEAHNFFAHAPKLFRAINSCLKQIPTTHFQDMKNLRVLFDPSPPGTYQIFLWPCAFTKPGGINIENGPYIIIR